MKTQHLSDEAVAACADGMLRGHAHERAGRHLQACAECAGAVRVQREAVLALRAAPPPALPAGLASRLRSVPQTTPLETQPTVLAEDGTAMFATLASLAPAAALVPDPMVDGRAHLSLHRAKPFLASTAVVALAGALVAGSVAHGVADPQPGTGRTARDVAPATGPAHDGELVAPTMVSAVHLFGGRPR